MPQPQDIEGRPEIIRLVDHFYHRVRADDLLGFIFDGSINSRINKIPDPRFDPANLTPEQRARYAAYKEKAGETAS